jgi:hypothetical protein
MAPPHANPFGFCPERGKLLEVVSNLAIIDQHFRR